MAREPCLYRTRSSTTACGWLRAKFLRIEGDDDDFDESSDGDAERMSRSGGWLSRYESVVAAAVVGER